MVSFTPRPLYLRYPLYRRLGGPESYCVDVMEKRKFLALARNRTLTTRSSSPYPGQYTDFLYKFITIKPAESRGSVVD